MSDDEINVAVAEACPSVFVRPIGSGGWNYRSSVTGRIMPCTDGSPLKDLNAMHQAEKVCLTAAQAYTYYETVRTIIVRDLNDTGQTCHGLPCHDMAFINATARQRAEAFLRTLGKWPDETTRKDRP